ncbi:phospholipase-like protein [Tanacetum coccineum]
MEGWENGLMRVTLGKLSSVERTTFGVLDGSQDNTKGDTSLAKDGEDATIDTTPNPSRIGKRLKEQLCDLQLERLVNQIVVNEGNGGSSKDPMSTCSRPDMDNVEVAGDGMPIGNADGNHDIGIGLHNAINQGLVIFLSCVDMDNGEVACSGMGIDKVDGMNDIPNLNHNCVNQRKGGSTNDPMSTCSLTDMDNGEVACDGMVIDKADGKNEYTYSQRAPSTLDVLIKALDCANDNPGIDVLQHDNDVDRSVAELNHHPIADIHVEPIHVYDFADDYMFVLNDEEHEAKYSLDEMKLIDEEEKLIVKDPPVKQHVDAFIDEQEDKTTVLQENVKHESNKSQSFNVVKDDYKPCLASVFSNVKPKRKKCGVERNYVLRSVKERKKRLAMSLHSPYGQQVTTTPAPPKTRSQSVNGDYIAAPEFKEHLDLWVDLMWYFRDPDADWAMVSSGVVYFPVNEPKKHWCLAELHISTGVVTFYDSLGYVCGNRRPWWRTMKRNLPQQLTLYLNEHGVLKSKGIPVESLSHKLPLAVKDPLQTALAYREWIVEYFWRHKIKAKPPVLPVEGSMISVDENLIHTPVFRNLVIANLKPIGTSQGIWGFSYCNNMMVCIANPSINKEIGVFIPNNQADSCKILLGFGVRPDNLDPTVVKISYPSSGEGNWSVYVFTLSSLTWNQLDINRLPRKSIRFKRSTQAVVGQFIYWVGHERLNAYSGESYKHYLLVSFDMINHRFKVIDILDVFRFRYMFPIFETLSYFVEIYLHLHTMYLSVASYQLMVVL